MKVGQLSLEEARKLLAEHGLLPISGGNGTDDESEDDEDEDDEDGGTGADPEKTQKQSKKPASQVDIDRIVRRKLAAAKTKLTEEIRDELRQEAERDKAKKDGDLQRQLDLANKQLEDVPTLKKMVLRYNELAEERFNTALESLPEVIREMAPDDDADPLEKEEWLNRALVAASKIKSDTTDETGDDGKKKPTQQQRAKPGFRFRDPKNEQPPDEGKLKKIMENFQASTLYRSMG